MTDIDKAVELARSCLDTTIQVVDWAEAEYARSGGCEECRDVRSPTARRLAEAVLAMAAVVEAARAQSAAWDKHLSGLDGPGGVAYRDWERATNRTEHAIRALDARCDGDHSEPACSDAGCWQRDSGEVERG